MYARVYLSAPVYIDTNTQTLAYFVMMYSFFTRLFVLALYCVEILTSLLLLLLILQLPAINAVQFSYFKVNAADASIFPCAALHIPHSILRVPVVRRVFLFSTPKYNMLTIWCSGTYA